ncbi:hypothetical protein GN956_G14712 [Arapaima gigas]
MKRSLQVLSCQLLSILAVLAGPAGSAGSRETSLRLALPTRSAAPSPTPTFSPAAVESQRRNEREPEGPRPVAPWGVDASVQPNQSPASEQPSSADSPSPTSVPPAASTSLHSAPPTGASGSSSTPETDAALSPVPLNRTVHPLRPLTNGTDPPAGPDRFRSFSTADPPPSATSRVPLATRAPRGAGGPPDPFPSRSTVCLGKADVVWVALAASVAVSSCSVMLTVCCLRRRRKSSGQDRSVSYWNNSITTDYFSRHAVELPKEIRAPDAAEEQEARLPPNREFDNVGEVLVNPFSQETLFIKTDEMSDS